MNDTNETFDWDEPLNETMAPINYTVTQSLPVANHSVSESSVLVIILGLLIIKIIGLFSFLTYKYIMTRKQLKELKEEKEKEEKENEPV
jgi:hypothetical protein